MNLIYYPMGIFQQVRSRYLKVLVLLVLSIHFIPSFCQDVDTVNNYFQLRTYSGAKSILYIDHERYFGLFEKSDIDQQEDYGTFILTNTNSWKRVFSNYSPRFWEIGGKSPDNLVKKVLLEGDAINSAAWSAHMAGGDTIELDKMYGLDRSLYLFSNNTYLGTTDSSGFFRIDPPKTVLTDTAKVGEGKLSVQSTEGFKTFQKINIVNGQAYDSIAKHVSYTASVSSFSGPKTILLSGRKVQKQMHPGDTVSLFFLMMTPRFTSLDSVVLKNLIFQGNRKNYNLNYDWRVNTTINLSTTNFSVIEECRFYDIPSENIFLCGSIVTNCSGRGFNGSALHFSCNTDDRKTEVLHNNFTETNAVGDSIMEHSEASFTFSAKVRNLRVSYNTINQINEYGIGIFKNDDFSNEITDNLFNTNKDLVGFTPFYSEDNSNVIYNNKSLNFDEPETDVSCWSSFPKLTSELICNANSSLEKPLQIGEILEITIDSILVRKTNENFIKEIIPIVDQEFFKVSNITLETPNISQHHVWFFDSSGLEPKLVFDNGFGNQSNEKDNWGYELCSRNGECFELIVFLEVVKAPIQTQEVNCPLQGVRSVFDGDTDSWRYAKTCENSPVYFDESVLGKPFLQGNNPLSVNSTNQIIYPNPTKNSLTIRTYSDAHIDFQIFDTSGQFIKLDKYQNGTAYVGDLKAGIYFISWIENGLMVQFKFIKF